MVIAQVQGLLVNEHSRRFNIISVSNTVIVASFAPERRVFFVIMIIIVVIRVFFVCVSSVLHAREEGLAFAVCSGLASTLFAATTAAAGWRQG